MGGGHGDDGWHTGCGGTGHGQGVCITGQHAGLGGWGGGRGQAWHTGCGAGHRQGAG